MSCCPSHIRLLPGEAEDHSFPCPARSDHACPPQFFPGVCQVHRSTGTGTVRIVTSSRMACKFFLSDRGKPGISGCSCNSGILDCISKGHNRVRKTDTPAKFSCFGERDKNSRAYPQKPVSEARAGFGFFAIAYSIAPRASRTAISPSSVLSRFNLISPLSLRLSLVHLI